MHYTKIKEQLSALIDASSWEQVLFAMSQLAGDEEEELEESDENYELNKYSKLANDLHDLSNLMG